MEVLKLAIMLFITVFAYLVFPIIYVKTNGKVSEKRGKKIALLNSAVCAFIFIIMGFVIGLTPTSNGSMLAPAFFYYFIAKSILIDRSLPDAEESNKIKKETNNDVGLQREDKISDDNQIFDYKNMVEDGLPRIDNGSAKNSLNNNSYCVEGVSLLRDNIITMQKVTVIIFCLFVIFSIVYPLIAYYVRDSKIPAETEYKTTYLNDIDPLQTIYCESNGKFNYIYIKQDSEIVIYRFQNILRYNSSGGFLYGYATTKQIKEQFSKVKNGKPNVFYVSPTTSVIGWCLGCVFVAGLITLCITIHRKVEEDLFRLGRENKTLIDLKIKYKTESISLSTYKQRRKNYYAKYILKNNKFFDLFKFLY